jgi:hypothetical protein
MPEDLPICFDRWCKNRARYQVPHFVKEDGTDGPTIAVCKTHLRIHEKLNDGTRRRQELHQRLDHLDLVLIPALVEAFERKAKIKLTGVSKESAGRRVGITTEDATKILAWLTR